MRTGLRRVGVESRIERGGRISPGIFPMPITIYSRGRANTFAAVNNTFALAGRFIAITNPGRCPGLCAFGPSARISPVRRPAPSLYPQILHGTHHKSGGATSGTYDLCCCSTNIKCIDGAFLVCRTTHTATGCSNGATL